MQLKPGKLFLLSAPSGAGKTSLLEQAVERVGSEFNLERVVTYTSRKLLAAEQQGIHYHFLTEEEFLSKLREDFFVEHSTAYGRYYGFPKEVLAQVLSGRNYIGIVDMAGAASIKAAFDEAILIGIRPSNAAILERRLAHRGRETQKEIGFRLKLAYDELQVMTNGLFRYVVMNDDFDAALNRLITIIRQEISSVEDAR